MGKSFTSQVFGFRINRMEQRLASRIGNRAEPNTVLATVLRSVPIFKHASADLIARCRASGIKLASIGIPNAELLPPRQQLIDTLTLFNGSGVVGNTVTTPGGFKGVFIDFEVTAIVGSPTLQIIMQASWAPGIFHNYCQMGSAVAVSAGSYCALCVYPTTLSTPPGTAGNALFAGGMPLTWRLNYTASVASTTISGTSYANWLP